MDLEDFDDPDFGLGGGYEPSGVAVDSRPISQMFAEPLHVEDDIDMSGVTSDYGAFDSNFDGDFAGFDGGFSGGFSNAFSGVDSDFGAMSSASLPALNTIPDRSSMDTISDLSSTSAFGGSGFAIRSPPPPSANPPESSRDRLPCIPGGWTGKIALCICILLYTLLVILFFLFGVRA